MTPSSLESDQMHVGTLARLALKPKLSYETLLYGTAVSRMMFPPHLMC